MPNPLSSTCLAPLLVLAIAPTPAVAQETPSDTLLTVQHYMNYETVEDPRLSPDGTQIVYDSDVEGDFEVYIRNLDPNSAPRQLTNNGQDDRWAIYAQ